MSMKLCAASGLAALVLFLGPSRAVAQEQTPPPAPAEQPSTPSCGDCHDQAKAFLTNPHARGAVVKGVVANDVCETCHGSGAEHIEGGGDKTKITVPRGRTGAEDVCLMCHDTTAPNFSPRTGMHATSETVNCLTCHSIHSADKKSTHLVAKPQLALCGSCHTQAASFRNKPYAHRLDRGGMECSTCHEPHGRPSSGTRALTLPNHLRVTRAGEPVCTSCHAEKRGPWVFPHGGNEVADCTSCHDSHGSVYPKMLKRATVAQVCLECHSPLGDATLGSQPPSFHNLNNPRYQNCTTCHVAVHGSNRDPQLFK